GRCEINRGDYAAAEPNLLEAHRIESTAPFNPGETGDAGSISIHALAQLYEAWARKDPSKAVKAAYWEQMYAEGRKAGEEPNPSDPAAKVQGPYPDVKKPD